MLKSRFASPAVVYRNPIQAKTHGLVPSAAHAYLSFQVGFIPGRLATILLLYEPPDRPLVHIT